MTDKNKFHFSRKDTADIMGITAIALGQWKVDWDIKQGNATFYDIRKVVKHRLARDDVPSQSNLTSERTRLAKAQADNQELDLKVKRGELIPIPVIASHWQSMVMAMRSKLLAMPSKLAVAALDAGSLKEIEDVVTQLIYEALDEISEDGIPTETSGAGEEDILDASTTTKVDSKSMGRRVPAIKPGSKRRAGAVEN